MPQSKRLQNYIRSARKKAGLTQDEVAYLLGGRGGKLISRYELFEREPMLPAALALEAVLGVPSRELFAGIYEEALETVKRRAKVMEWQLNSKSDSKTVELKRQTIRRIIEADAAISYPNSK